jgi:ribonuclease HII
MANKVQDILKSGFTVDLLEAGCDEAGRGCLAGPVTAAAVILPIHYSNNAIKDSKKLTPKERHDLRDVIRHDALAWAVALATHEEIDEINILNATFLAMHRALQQLSITPALILIDGHRFKPFGSIRHQCIVKGDQQYLSIAAASILAKTARDDYMITLHDEYPIYNWRKNKGYATPEHKVAVFRYGLSPYHRKSFTLNRQLKLHM